MEHNSSSSSSIASGNQKIDEETIKKVIAAIKLLEKLGENGDVVEEKMKEIKQEIEKRYPIINLSICKNTQIDDDDSDEKEEDNYIPKSQEYFKSSIHGNLINQANQQQMNMMQFQLMQSQYHQFIEQNRSLLGLPQLKNSSGVYPFQEVMYPTQQFNSQFPPAFNNNNPFGGSGVRY